MQEQPPPKLSAEEWFELVGEHVRTLHRTTHIACDTNDGPTGELRVLVQRFADVFEWLANSSSWDEQRLYPFDKAAILHELEERVLWRLRR